MSDELETYTVKVCRECGAEYSTSASLRHIHQGNFKRVKRTRPRRESVISYQPGCEPGGAQ